MENLLLISSILLVHLLAWFTPGPNLVLIIRNSLVYSRKAGFLTATGFALSNLIHILISVAGISLLISSSAVVASSIKFIGVGYLLYLGVKTFILNTKFQAVTSAEKHHNISSFVAIKTGLVTNLLSPKAPLFFGSIFGTLLSSGTPFWVITVLMIAMPLNTLLMASLWSIFFSQTHIRKLYIKFQPAVNKCLGIVLIVLAIGILIS